jgi:hypothetical protein
MSMQAVGLSLPSAAQQQPGKRAAAEGDGLNGLGAGPGGLFFGLEGPAPAGAQVAVADGMMMAHSGGGDGEAAALQHDDDSESSDCEEPAAPTASQLKQERAFAKSLHPLDPSGSRTVRCGGAQRRMQAQVFGAQCVPFVNLHATCPAWLTAQILHYHVVRRLGQGGLCTVFKAEVRRLRQLLARCSRSAYP